MIRFVLDHPVAFALLFGALSAGATGLGIVIGVGLARLYRWRGWFC